MKLSDLINNFEYINVDGKGSNVDIKQLNINQLVVGITVELEHGSDLNKAMSIAVDHLSENENYYSILIKFGLVDEPKALYLAKKYLGIDIEKKGKDEELTNILLGFNPLNKNDYSR
jgi:hypothetical protein